MASGSQSNAMSVWIQALRRFSIESEVDEDIGKRESVECHVWFGYRHYDASRPSLKSMTILASGGQPNAVFGSGTGVTMLSDRIYS